ncbi:hypothetical protein SA58113_0386 [Staphylococcus argenteus]|nr:hypothetical protein SA58113_0386 [Staphylococcus argenteus]
MNINSSLFSNNIQEDKTMAIVGTIIKIIKAIIDIFVK